MAGVAQVKVTGLRELGRAFAKYNKSLAKEFAGQLAEAGQPVARRASQYTTSGGGGFPAMRGVVGRSAYVAEMKVGASRNLGKAWVAPAWRSNKGTLQGQILAVQLRFRMEGALEDEKEEVEKLVDQWLGQLGNEWER